MGDAGHRRSGARQGGLRHFFLVARELTGTNAALLEAARATFAHAALVDAHELATRVEERDLVLGRLDVRPRFDGIEEGLLELQDFEVVSHGGVLNRAGALFVCHDKAATAVALRTAGIRHPQTETIFHPGELAELEPPVVVKPRLGSFGADVFRCETALEFRRCFREISDRPWFQAQGALVQELIAPTGSDLRIVVAGDAIVGAIVRQASEGEWRTNISLGGTRHTVRSIPTAAAEMALSAAAAVRADLVGVDLMPHPDGGWVVIELNGAVDFTHDYSRYGTDVFAAVISRLVIRALQKTNAPAAGFAG